MGSIDDAMQDTVSSDKTDILAPVTADKQKIMAPSNDAAILGVLYEIGLYIIRMGLARSRYRTPPPPPSPTTAPDTLTYTRAHGMSSGPKVATFLPLVCLLVKRGRSRYLHGHYLRPLRPPDGHARGRAAGSPQLSR